MAALWSLLGAPASEGQFLSRDVRPHWGEAYENYGATGYRDALQPTLFLSPTEEQEELENLVTGFGLQLERRQYDPFGNYLVDGLDVFRLEEFRTIAPAQGSVVFKSPLYSSVFQNLVIVQDQFSGWSTRVLIGDAIRTKFTSLTLNTARLNGVRWDGATRKNRFTLLGSRVSDPGRLGDDAVQRFSTYLYGGRWENTLGDVLTMGISYVTLFRTDASLRGRHVQRGVVPVDLGGAQDLYVVFSDDSPLDGDGAEVYQLQILIDGEPTSLEPAITLLPRAEALVKFTDDSQDDRPLPREYLSYLRADASWVPQAIHYNTPVAPLTRLQQLLDVGGVAVAFSGAGPLEAHGTDVLVFRYAVPTGARSASFRALVASDYAIDVGTTLSNWSDLHNVKRAAGRPTTGANLEWVDFEFGFPTGLVTYGADVRLNLLGAQVHAELADNIRYDAFPGVGGSQQSAQARAWAAQFLRPFGPVTVAGEVFEIPAAYATSFPSIQPAGNNAPVRPFSLVEDNDDGDEWADSGDRDGVFPGLDEDRDGIIDTNVNANGIPDYEEPFLMYYVDPDEFVYGEDLDNNGVVDAREDDNRPDYPYRLDRRGAHLFADLRLADGLRSTPGWYRERRPVGGGRSQVSYHELAYETNRPGLGDARLAYLLKRVRDDIPEDIHGGYLNATGFVTESSIRPDPLSLRNSLVHLLYAEARYRGVEGLNLAYKVRYQVNDRRADTFADGTVQGGGRQRDWAAVARGDYAWQRGDLTLTPMVKVRLQKKSDPVRGREPLLYTRHLIPILRLDYAFTPATVLRLGIQGLPHLQEAFRNQAWPFDRYDATSQVAILQTSGNYSGYNLTLNLGWLHTRRDVAGYQGSRSGSRSELFVQVYVE